MKGIKQIKDYRLIKELGRGANGVVYEAVDEKTNKMVAIKAISNDKINNPRLMEQFKKELKTLFRLSNKNIIKIIGVEKTINNVYLILEYCNGGTLYDYFKYYLKTFNTRLPESIVQKIIRQLIEGLKFMHKNNIIHRDIKLENILINFDDHINEYSDLSTEKTIRDLYKTYDLSNANITIKIADLGYARELENGMGANTICGTPITIAPEIVNLYSNSGKDSKYNSAIDIWSFGAVFYELLFGLSPFINNSQEGILRKIFNGVYTIPSDILISLESLYLLNGLLQFYPEKRLNWDQIAFHPFITKDFKKFKFIKLNTFIDSSKRIKLDGDFDSSNKFLVDTKDCRNFLWVIFKACGASLPFDLEELDKDTYEEILKDVIADQMLNEQDNQKAELVIDSQINNNQPLNNKVNVNINFKNINKEEVNKIQESYDNNKFEKINVHQEILNNESNFHLFNDNNTNYKNPKEVSNDGIRESDQFCLFEKDIFMKDKKKIQGIQKENPDEKVYSYNKQEIEYHQEDQKDFGISNLKITNLKSIEEINEDLIKESNFETKENYTYRINNSIKSKYPLQKDSEKSIKIY